MTHPQHKPTVRPWVPIAGVIISLAGIVVTAGLTISWGAAAFWGSLALFLFSVLTYLSRPAPVQPAHRAQPRSPLDGS